MNINEIAKMAGVSRATVSRYLNHGYVSEDKRASIQAVIDATGSQPSAQAQTMRTKKTQVIGVRMADRAGALAEVLAILRDAKIAVEYAYAFITHSKSDACVVLRVEDNESALRALSAHGIAFLEDIQ